MSNSNSNIEYVVICSYWDIDIERFSTEEDARKEYERLKAIPYRGTLTLAKLEVLEEV